MALGYSAEARLLEEFGSRFAEYRALDETILGLAVENTNLKAQRLSFGPAQEAADAFRDALMAITQSGRSKIPGGSRPSPPRRLPRCARFRYCRPRTLPNPMTGR